MLPEFHDLLTRGEKNELFKLCCNRCHAALNVVFEYETAKDDSLWNIDERYHEQSIEILQERFSYAMAMVVDGFRKESRELYRAPQNSAITLQVFLGGAVDEMFKLNLRDVGFNDATTAYNEADFLDEGYEVFWDKHSKIAGEIVAVRKGFRREERTFLHGFAEEEDDDDTANRDCFHVMRACQKWQKVNVEKFLTDTKRVYLPMIVTLFLTEPIQDLWAPKPSAKWWQFWQRPKRS